VTTATQRHCLYQIIDPSVHLFSSSNRAERSRAPPALVVFHVEHELVPARCRCDRALDQHTAVRAGAWRGTAEPAPEVGTVSGSMRRDASTVLLSGRTSQRSPVSGRKAVDDGEVEFGGVTDGSSGCSGTSADKPGLGESSVDAAMGWG
jgi:hypothetical protein